MYPRRSVRVETNGSLVDLRLPSYGVLACTPYSRSAYGYTVCKLAVYSNCKLKLLRHVTMYTLRAPLPNFEGR